MILSGNQEHRFYSELLLQGAPCHPAEETHFSSLCPRFCPFGPDPKRMATGEGRDSAEFVFPLLYFVININIYFILMLKTLSVTQLNE